MDRPLGAYRFPRRLCDGNVGRPIAAADTDAADAFAVDDDRATAFHRGPAFGARRQRKSYRMRNIEGLRLRAVRGSWTPVRSRAHRLGARRVHGMQTPPVH